MGRWRAAALALAVGIALLPMSCARGPAEAIDYAVDGVLPTYNTNTVVGASSSGPRAFARVLTGFGYRGPDGQIVGDRDFGTIAVVGRAPLVLDYTIDDNAVYSDGKPVTCDDVVLAWVTQSGRLPGFDAASRAGYRDIAAVDCVPGQRKARVSFEPDRPLVDYTQLFAATSMMPSHVIADELGVDVTRELQQALQAPEQAPGQANDPAKAVARIAEAWNTIWDLKPGVDPKRFPSSGPYKLESVRPDRAVVLTANDRWWGQPPTTRRITVWPNGTKVQDRIDDASLDVVDIADGSAGTLTVPDRYQRADAPSAGIEQLIFSAQGPMAATPARRALALCTPRDRIAENAGVPIANARLDTADDDTFGAAESGVEAGGFTAANADAARAELHNAPLTVRIGYSRPNARLAATVATIAAACAPAGITVQDVASEAIGPLSLAGGHADVLLSGIGGAAGGGSTGSSDMDAYDLHSGNGNNLSGYANSRVDGIIDGLAVTSDPKQIAGLLDEGSRLLWADLPTLPLYRQQRTLITSKKVSAVLANPTRWGAGWNMDRWTLRR